MQSPTGKHTVLFVDDDPDHLKIYSWIVEKAGFSCVPCRVEPSGVSFPEDQPVDLIVLDYTLNCRISTPEIARLLTANYPKAPIVLLSRIDGLPCDMEPFVKMFVQKGEPQKLTDAILKLLSEDEPTSLNQH